MVVSEKKRRAWSEALGRDSTAIPRPVRGMLRTFMAHTPTTSPLDDALSRIETIARTDTEPALGWPLPHVLEHCAQSIEFSIDGFPKLKPWVIRATVGKLVARRFIARGALRHDLAAPIPSAPALEQTQIESALCRLRDAVERFHSREGPLAPHFIFGELSKSQYEQLHALHVLDHLRAFQPE
jgi:hypothetical protein